LKFSHLRPVILDLGAALGLSIFGLVFPDHIVRSDDTRKPVVEDDLRPSLSVFVPFLLVLDDAFRFVCYF
jgi:hypothetical protein